jgi:hypothetical protein
MCRIALLVLLAGLLLAVAGCNRSELADMAMSGADSALRGACVKAGNCEVHCAGDGMRPDRNGQCTRLPD